MKQVGQQNVALCIKLDALILDEDAVFVSVSLPFDLQINGRLEWIYRVHLRILFFPFDIDAILKEVAKAFFSVFKLAGRFFRRCLSFQFAVNHRHVYFIFPLWRDEARR